MWDESRTRSDRQQPRLLTGQFSSYRGRGKNQALQKAKATQGGGSSLCLDFHRAAATRQLHIRTRKEEQVHREHCQEHLPSSPGQSPGTDFLATFLLLFQ